MITASALYTGSVMHRRVRPIPHTLRYRVFWFLLDLDEINLISNGLWLFSRNRFNALGFYDADYGDGGQTSLREQIEIALRKANIAASSRIRLLTMPRVLGYAFNPLSLYFCYDANEQLKAVVYEVHNTFRERHSYVIPVEAQSCIFDQQCEKQFHVSPFLSMDMRYAFRVAPPDARVDVAIRGYDRSGLLISTALSGKHKTLTDWTVFCALVAFPFLTLKVVAAIHWHALRLYVKGLKVYPHRPSPHFSTTVAPAKESR
jgi:uncharacterized protein